MSKAEPSSSRAAWNRRVPGWTFLAFFFALIVLTYAAVYSYNIGSALLTGYFTGLASVAPLVLVLLAYYLWPIWAFQVPSPGTVVARAMESVARGRVLEPVSDRTRPFGKCTTVLHVREPACTIGWLPGEGPNAPARPPGSILFLRPETRDRKALATFREAIARSLLEAARTATD